MIDPEWAAGAESSLLSLQVQEGSWTLNMSVTRVYAPESAPSCPRCRGRAYRNMTQHDACMFENEGGLFTMKREDTRKGAWIKREWGYAFSVSTVTRGTRKGIHGGY